MNENIENLMIAIINQSINDIRNGLDKRNFDKNFFSAIQFLSKCEYINSMDYIRNELKKEILSKTNDNDIINIVKEW